MAKNLFDQLKDLFSSKVIVKGVGGKKVKVADINAVQRTMQGYVHDRFNRLYSSTNRRGDYYNERLNLGLGVPVGTYRKLLFRDYESMDLDPIISSALDIYSEECTMKNEMNDVLRIKAESEKVKDILDNLFFDILNVEFNLPTWSRGLSKYGDFFLELTISKKYGVINAQPISPYEIERLEGIDPEKPNYVKFKIENLKKELEFFEVAHFRLNIDTNYLPYGKSMVEGARREWKRLMLMEDAMMIHRIMRAPEKRIFKIDVGNLAPDQVDIFMEKIVSQIKKIPYMDPSTGEYNLKFNLQNMLEDFYVPVRGGDSGTEIDTLSGLEYNAIEDIEYLLKKMLAGLKIPRAFLGYEEEVGSKATLASEDVRFARTIEKIQKVLVAELTKIAIIHLFSLGFDNEDLLGFELSLTTPSIIYEQEKIELLSSKVSLARDYVDLEMFSSEKIYKDVFGLSDTEIEKERERVIEDVKRKYRIEKIKDEGIDPKYQTEDEETVEEATNLSDKRRGNKSRDRKKDEPFGEDPIGQHDYETILKIDKDLNFIDKEKRDKKKKKRSEKEEEKEKKESSSELINKTNKMKIINEIDFKNLKNYFKEND